MLIGISSIMFHTKGEIEENILIDLVKERDYMWNPHSTSFRNITQKRKGWNEIANIIHPNFKQLSWTEQDEIIIDLRRRWKSLIARVRRCTQHNEFDFDAGQIKFLRKISFLLPFQGASRTQLELWTRELSGEDAKAESHYAPTSITPCTANTSAVPRACSANVGFEAALTNLLQYVTQQHIDVHPTVDPFIDLLRGMLIALPPERQPDFQMGIFEIVKNFQDAQFTDDT